MESHAHFKFKTNDKEHYHGGPGVAGVHLNE
jgi:hypothetical protein